MISTAHIFYIPVLLLIGAFAGYYIGRWAADKEAVEADKKARRREALKRKSEQSEE